MWLLRNSWLLVSGILVLAGILVEAPLILMVGSFAFITGGVARAWGRMALRRVRYSRSLSETRAFEGEEIGLTVTLVNDKPLPLPWVEITDHLPEAMEALDVHTSPSAAPGYLLFRRSTSLGWYERVSWTNRLRCSRRGFFRLGPAHLKSSDLFGVFVEEREVDEFVDITVYPRIYLLEDLGIPAHRPFGEHLGGRDLFADPTRIRALRDYRPGDPLRRIDWKASARRSSLVARVYEPAATRQVVIALNADTFEHNWEGYDPVVLERAVSVAGSVAVAMLDERFGVGLVSNGSFPLADRPIVIPPGRGPAQATRILEALAAVQPLTLKPLTETLAAAGPSIPSGSTILAVTGLVTNAFLGSLLRLRDAGHRVVIAWVADATPPAETGGLPLLNLAGALRRVGGEPPATPAPSREAAGALP